MQYALLLYDDEVAMGKDQGGAIFQELVRQHRAFSTALRASGVQVGGSGLRSTTSATTLRNTPSGRTIHDGPFAESKEQLGGFYLIEVPDLDAAIAVARRVPLSAGGSVEIRALIPPPAG